MYFWACFMGFMSKDFIIGQSQWCMPQRPCQISLKTWLMNGDDTTAQISIILDVNTLQGNLQYARRSPQYVSLQAVHMSAYELSHLFMVRSAYYRAWPLYIAHWTTQKSYRTVQISLSFLDIFEAILQWQGLCFWCGIDNKERGINNKGKKYIQRKIWGYLGSLFSA